MTLCEVWWNGQFAVHERSFMATAATDGIVYVCADGLHPQSIRASELLVLGAVRPDTVYCLPGDVLRAKQIIAEAQKAEAVRLIEEADAAHSLYDEMMIRLYGKE